ncbi:MULTISPECIES: helix-turn-helix transcriptional regulator [unclassified Rhodococcus (in: high G+C Gram-positive bacteria)]|uniref:helix-turn-helix domain-containing protein n=1 Tax=unclassified Rhodococcus (in: high G+C Gram-positive bacteria) TaxID=192944 RepID=UPI00339903D5
MIPGMEGADATELLGVDLARAQNRLVRLLRDRRIELGLSGSQVAERMNVDPSVVSRFERGGTNATLATIRRYAKAVEAMVTYEVCSREEHRKKTVSARADALIATWSAAELSEPDMQSATTPLVPSATVLRRQFSAQPFPAAITSA